MQIKNNSDAQPKQPGRHCWKRVGAEGSNLWEDSHYANDEDTQKDENIAEKQDFRGKKWQCVVHGCTVEHGHDLDCTCCDSCQGFVYDSDEDEEEDEPWDPA